MTLHTTRPKPCPFCGGNAVARYHNGGWPDHCYRFECEDWKCPSKTSSGSEEIALAAWNTRYSEAQSDD